MQRNVYSEAHARSMTGSSEIMAVLADAKRIAKRYRSLTGRPLGVTGEIAEYEAARLLGLELVEVRKAGYDATRKRQGAIERIQIKGRVVLHGSNPGQRTGKIDIDKEWDSVILVLLNENFDATEMYEASRLAVIEALTAPGSKSRNERGALGVGKFKSIGRRIWPQD